MTTTFVELDVRPLQRAGQEPFGDIMRAVTALGPGQSLRLLATFEPVPLFSVLGAKGFTHEAREIGGGDWEVLFRPASAAPAVQDPAVAPDDAEWPEPVREMDNRDLDPPEPMVRIMAATEEMKAGEVLSALLCREPMFLIPELEKRGHGWRGGFEPDGAPIGFSCGSASARAPLHDPRRPRQEGSAPACSFKPKRCRTRPL